MKIRESGMPEREMWEKFFSPAKILAALGLTSQKRIWIIRPFMSCSFHA